MQVVVWRNSNKYGMCIKEDLKKLALRDSARSSARIVRIPQSSWDQFRFHQNGREGQIYLKQIWSEGIAYRSKNA